MAKCVIVIGILILYSICAKAEWDFLRREDDITIYYKKDDYINLISFKGVSIINHNPASVLKFIMGNERDFSWLINIESKILEKIDWPNEYIQYFKIKMPLFISDREFITRVKIKHNARAKSVRVSFNRVKSLKYRKSKYKGDILGDLNGSYFTLEELDGGQRTLLTGVAKIDPKGMIPTWFTNLCLESWPLETIKKIKKGTLLAEKKGN